MGLGDNKKNFFEEKFDWLEGGPRQVFLVILSSVFAVSGGVFQVIWFEDTFLHSFISLVLSVLVLIILAIFGFSRLGLVGDPLRKFISGLGSAGGVGLSLLLLLFFGDASNFSTELVAFLMGICFAGGVWFTSKLDFAPVKSFTYSSGIIAIAIPTVDGLEDSIILPGLLALALILGSVELAIEERLKNYFRALTGFSIITFSAIYYEDLKDYSYTTQDWFIFFIVIGFSAFALLSLSIYMNRRGKS